MKKNEKNKTAVESNNPGSSKKTAGSELPGSAAKPREKNESTDKRSYSFQKDESVDKDKLAPREEL